MKNHRRLLFLAVFASVLVLGSLIPLEGSCQKKTTEETLAVFPDNVSGIMKNSCVGCHSDLSKSKAKMFMNLSEWDKLKKSKQVKTGKKITKQIAKGSMPPKGFLERKPDAALTPEQIKTINDWSKSIRKSN